MYEDLERLATLRDKGAITEEEFQKEKTRILADIEAKSQKQHPSTPSRLWGMDEKGYSSMMHIAQFGGMIIPVAGLALPIIMWISGKDDSEVVDKHGKNIVNWMISVLIYLAISGILVVIGIGLLGLIAVGILNIIFVIKGAIKANDGEIWEYPMTIKIL